MTTPSRQVRRYHARVAAKKSESALWQAHHTLPPIRVEYDPLPASKLARSKYVPHHGKKEAKNA